MKDYCHSRRRRCHTVSLYFIYPDRIKRRRMQTRGNPLTMQKTPLAKWFRGVGLHRLYWTASPPSWGHHNVGTRHISWSGRKTCRRCGHQSPRHSRRYEDRGPRTHPTQWKSTKPPEKVEVGFKGNTSRLDLVPGIREFFQFKDGLSTVDGVIFYNNRTVIPSPLREEP